MRNIHKVKKTIEYKCNKCGLEFNKTIRVIIVTNQKGDVVEATIK